MSLLIVGSCSRITQNIIHNLSAAKQYNRITIMDLLPIYNFHNRYYDIRRQLAASKSETDVKIDKIFEQQCVRRAMPSHDDVLYVTHDYYVNVISKTQLMLATARFAKYCKKENVVFATPKDYDHYGFQNPEANYLKAEKAIREQILPTATIIRSDLQIKYSSGAVSNSLKTSLYVNPKHYAQVVADALKNKQTGSYINVEADPTKAWTGKESELSHEEVYQHRHNCSL